MKLRSLFLVGFLLNLVVSLAQPGSGWMEKVKWSFKLEKIDDKTANIVGTATLIEGWHIFSVDHDPAKADFTGVPTQFFVKGNANFKPIGKVKDAKKPTPHVDDLGTSLYFEKKAVFIQKIEVLTDKDFEISFDYAFQICDENGCIFPPDQTAKVKVSGFKPPTSVETPKEDLIIDGDFATDKEGKKYVKHNNQWVMVPEGNSPKFYKKYLLLGGK